MFSSSLQVPESLASLGGSSLRSRGRAWVGCAGGGAISTNIILFIVHGLTLANIVALAHVVM